MLVHGFLSSRSQWLLNLDQLATACRPVTVELFGHHDSTSPADSSCYHPEYYLRCFEAIRTRLGIERWFVLGYSLGAGLTLRYVFEHPDQIIGHLFTNSTSGLADEQRIGEFHASAESAAERIRSGGIAAIERIPVHPKHGWRLPKPVYNALVEDAACHNPDGIANTIAITTPETSMRARLAENVRPACMIWGTREKRFAPLAEYVRGHMPNLETVALEAGHGMNMEAADAFNEAVIAFITRHQALVTDSDE